MEFYYGKFLFFVIIMPFVVVIPDFASGGTIAPPGSSATDILQPAAGACDPSLASPDVVAGTDAFGRPVALAGLPATGQPAPDVGPVIVERRIGERGGQTASVIVDPSVVIRSADSRTPCESEPRSPSSH